MGTRASEYKRRMGASGILPGDRGGEMHTALARGRRSVAGLAHGNGRSGEFLLDQRTATLDVGPRGGWLLRVVTAMQRLVRHSSDGKRRHPPPSDSGHLILGHATVRYETWERTVPDELARDPLWSLRVYRAALVRGPDRPPRCRVAGAETSIAVRSRTNCGAPRSRSAPTSPKATAASARRIDGKFYEYALGSARESRDWYFKAARSPGATNDEGTPGAAHKHHQDHDRPCESQPPRRRSMT